MTTLLFLVVAAIFLVLAVGLVRMQPRVVYWIVSLYAVTAWEYPNFGTIGTFGGTTITLGDGLAVSLITAALLDARAVVRRFQPVGVIAGAALVGAIWLSTFAVQVPCHARLASGFSPAAWRLLVRSNWLRTGMWSARLALATSLLW